MGLRIGPLIKSLGIGKKISSETLRNKVLAVDALVTIYQMLAMIRGPNGYFLTDKKGRITSHLVGIFNRECRLISMGVRSVYVFDGPPHTLKMRVIAKRKEEKRKYYKEFIQAVKRGDTDKAIKLGKRSMFVTDEMINETKKLLKLLGIPTIQAIHDAEAQAAYMVNNNDAYALATRDWDAFLYGAKRIVMHWKLTPNTYLPTKLYTLEEFLRKANITRRELIEIAILIGTDYNPEGFKGIGPRTAYRLIKRYGSVDKLIELGKIKWKWNITPEDIRNAFMNHPINKNYEIHFSEPDIEGLIHFLVDEHNFSPQRVRQQIMLAIKGLRRIGKQISLTEII